MKNLLRVIIPDPSFVAVVRWLVVRPAVVRSDRLDLLDLDFLAGTRKGRK